MLATKGDRAPGRPRRVGGRLHRQDRKRPSLADVFAHRTPSSTSLYGAREVARSLGSRGLARSLPQTASAVPTPRRPWSSPPTCAASCRKSGRLVSRPTWRKFALGLECVAAPLFDHSQGRGLARYRGSGRAPHERSGAATRLASCASRRRRPPRSRRRAAGLTEGQPGAMFVPSPAIRSSVVMRTARSSPPRPAAHGGRAELLREARERERHTQALTFLEHEPEVLQEQLHLHLRLEAVVDHQRAAHVDHLRRAGAVFQDVQERLRRAARPSRRAPAPRPARPC